MLTFYDFSTGGGSGALANIEFVGAKTFTHTNTASAQTTSLTDLLDASGSPATLQEGDLLLVNLGMCRNAANIPQEELLCPGFLPAHTDLYSNDNDITNQQVQYMFVGANPPSTLTVPPNASAGFATAVTIHAFRNVDPTSPLDVTPTTATGLDTGRADCPAIVPATAGAWIIACGAGAADGGAVFTNPSGMSATTNHFQSAYSDASNDITVGTAIYTGWTSGSYDPAAFGGNLAAVTNSWTGVTIALRPIMTAAETSVSGSYDTLTIASGTVGSNLSDFPVMVDLADLSVGFWAGVAADGSDIRVTNSDGSVILPLDVANINTGTDTGRLYFKADLLSGSNNVFRIYYGTGKSALAADHVQGRNAVWRDTCHVAMDGWANINRSTGETFTFAGNTTNSSGQMVFDGTGDAAGIPVPLPTDLSMFVVGYLETGGGTHKTFSCYTISDTGGDWIQLKVRSTGNWATWNDTNTWLESATAASFNANFTSAYTHDAGTERRVYANGSSVANQAAAVSVFNGVRPQWVLGGEDLSPAETFKGKIDFAMFTNRVMSADEIAAIHNNWRSGSFYSIT